MTVLCSDLEVNWKSKILLYGDMFWLGIVSGELERL